MSTVCGVDGCRVGWVAVYHDLAAHRVWWGVASSLAGIVATGPTPDVIALDVPIGLPQAGPRLCDQEARRLLGARRSSVFPAPIRPTLQASTYQEASAARRSAEGRGMSVQAWAIVPKVREIDEALRADPELRRMVREVHPELCFYFLNDGRPMSYSKKTLAGREERRLALHAPFGRAVDTALSERRASECAIDDVLDAFAAVWTAARVVTGQAITVPLAPPRDSCDLVMEMVA